jgi:hypothetical protein
MIYTLASMTAPEASAHRASVSQAHHDIIAFIAIIKSMLLFHLHATLGNSYLGGG